MDAAVAVPLASAGLLVLAADVIATAPAAVFAHAITAIAATKQSGEQQFRAESSGLLLLAFSDHLRLLPDLLADNPFVFAGYRHPLLFRQQFGSAFDRLAAVAKLAAVAGVAEDRAHDVVAPVRLLARGNAFGVEAAGNRVIALAFQILPVHTSHHPRFLGDDLAGKFDDLAALFNFHRQLVPIARGIGHVPLVEPVLQSFLQRSEAPAVIDAGGEAGHL